MINNKKHILSFWLLLSVSFWASGQETIPLDTSSYRLLSSYQVEYYEAGTGFAQNSIHGFHLDDKGYLWVNNYAGMSSFDGEKFAHFSGPRYTPKAIGMLGFSLWAPDRINEEWVFPTDPYAFRRIYLDSNAHVLDWDANVKDKLPLEDSLSLGGQFLWELKDGTAYCAGLTSFYRRIEGKWIKGNFRISKEIFPWQLMPMNDALFFVDVDKQQWREYREGHLVAIHQLPFEWPLGAGMVQGVGSGKYFQIGSGLFEFIAEEPGKPYFKQLYKVDLPIPTMRSFMEDTITGNLFLGTLTNGFVRFKEPTFIRDSLLPGLELKSVTDNSSTEVNLANGRRIFIGKGGGISGEIEGKSIPIITNQPDLLKGVYQIELSKDFVWLLSPKALLQCSRLEINEFLDGKVDRLYCKSFLFSSKEEESPLLMAKTSGNDIIIKSEDVLLKINPTYLNEVKKPQINIASLKLNGEKIDLQNLLKLDREFGVLEYGFSVPYWLDRHNLWLEYRLLGGGSESWFPLNLKDKLKFQQLEAGNYELQLKLRLGFGSDSITTSSYKFEVIPFWYESLTIQLTALLLILILAFGLFSLRVKGIKKRKKDLSLLIEGKKRELESLNEVLRLNNLKLNRSKRDQERGFTERDEVVNLYTGKLRSPLKRIIKELHDLSKSEEHQTESTVKALGFIEEKAQATYAVTENFFNWIQEKEGLVKPQQIEIYLMEMVDEILHSYADQLNEKMIGIQNEIEAREIVYSDPNAIFIVLDVFINNAVKFSKRGQIRFSLIDQEEHKVLIIVDEGEGMSAEQLEMVRSGKSKGFGIAATQQLMDRLGLYMEIQSEIGVGTEVRLFFKAQQS